MENNNSSSQRQTRGGIGNPGEDPVGELVMRIIRGDEDDAPGRALKPAQVAKRAPVKMLIKPPTPRIPSPPIPERKSLPHYSLSKFIAPKMILIALITILLVVCATLNQELILKSVIDKRRNDDTKYFNTRRSSVSTRSSTQLGATPLSLNYYPKGGPVIVTLVTNIQKDVTELQTALKSLEFLEGDDANYPAPVLVFNEGDLSITQIHDIVNACKTRPIAFPIAKGFQEFPEEFDQEDPIFPLSRNSRKKWGYYHMIKFWINDIWKHPALKPFDIVMRIDSDSCFKEPNKYLPQFAHPHLLYQSQYVGYEASKQKYIQHLFEFSQKYMAVNQLIPKNPMLWQFVVSAHDASQSLPVFQSNLEISRKSFMQQPDVMAFHKAVTEEEPFGVFKYRWGDAVVRFLTMALFADDGYVMNSKITGYYHKDHCKAEEVTTALTRYRQTKKKTETLKDVIDIHEMQ